MYRTPKASGARHLTAHYEVTLTWKADGGADPGLQIFDLVERQLGLKLEPVEAPGEIVVVDHAEKPSEN
jgi:uncharacterized protein (TIGR03435 family)